MANSTVNLVKVVHIVYNENGKSFEELLTEGIKQANLQNIQKQIITSATLKKGEIAND